MSETIVITGASDGIGAAGARQLHKDGNRVVIVGRSPQKTQAIARELGAGHFLADFTKLDDVRKLAADLDRAYPRIDVLVNNAGGIFGDRAKTVDGFEKTFQVNAVATSFATGSDSFMRRIYTSRVGRAFMATPEKGASQMVWLAETIPGTDWQSGTYYEKNKPAKRNNPQALDPGLARALWDRSAGLLGQKVR